MNVVLNEMSKHISEPKTAASAQNRLFSTTLKYIWSSKDRLSLETVFEFSIYFH